MGDKNISGLDTLAEDPYALSAETEAATASQPAGALVKSTGKTLAPVGNIAMGPEQTAELLANMQQMVDDRTGAGSQFMRGLERASAWGSGGVQGPSQALSTLNAQQQREDESVFNMRQQMAAYKSNQAQQDALAKQKSSELGGGTNATGVGGGSGAFGTIAGLPQLAREALAAAKTPEEYNKLKARFGELAMNPEWSKPVDYVNARGDLDKAPLYIAANQANPNDARNTNVFKRADVATSDTGVSPLAIQKVESNNNPLAVSRAGAEGIMQVMPNTQTNPGFGVAPAKDKSPEELKRVGVDYYNAMRDRYKNDDLAAVAYNMGPGKTDEWLKSGASFNSLPQETKEYIGRVRLANAQLNRAPAATETTKPTFYQAQAQAESEKAGAVEQAQTTAKASLKEQDTFREQTNVHNVGFQSETAASMKAILKELGPNSKMLNSFNTPGMASAIGQLLTSGITTPIGAISMPGFNRAVLATKPGVTERELKLVDEFDTVTARLEAAVAQANRGQGSTSDAERVLFKKIGGSSLNSYEMLERAQQALEIKANFNKQAGSLMKNIENQTGKEVNWVKFRSSPEYRALEEKYVTDLANISKSIPQTSGTNRQQAAPHPGAALVNKYLK
jgi:hypothetical protein